MPPPSAALMEELIEEILLRLPPDEPASLFRASLVCKLWCRLISGPRFRRRYRGFHRTPPMLGFLCGRLASDGAQTRFVPTSAFCSMRATGVCFWNATQMGSSWFGTPITDEQREIPVPKLTGPGTWNAAVVCAAAAAGGAGSCNHLDCHRGPFLVLYVLSCSPETFICTYSSDAASWSDPIFTSQHDDRVDPNPFSSSVLVGNALSWSIERVLKYDLEFHELYHLVHHSLSILLCLEPQKTVGWDSPPYMNPNSTCCRGTHDRVIELETLLSSNAILAEPVLVGFVDRNGVILLRTDNALFTVHLKSKVKKVCDGARSIFSVVVPYMSFYTPALGGGLRGEGPSAGVSSA